MPGILLMLMLMLILPPQALSQCDPSTSVKNGAIRIIDDTLYKIFCKHGYTTIGDILVRCSDSGINTYCEKVECRELARLHNGIISPSGAIQPGESISIECNCGYRLMGPNELKCDRYGKWEPYDMLFCIPEKCPTMLNFPNGQKDPQELQEPGSNVTFTCNNGFKLRGPNMLQCTSNGTWVPNVMPFCERIVCYALPPVKNGMFYPSGKAEIGTNATLKCKEGFVVDGQDEFRCDESGKWTFQYTPFCKGVADTEKTDHICLIVVFTVCPLLLIAFVVAFGIYYYSIIKRKKRKLCQPDDDNVQLNSKDLNENRSVKKTLCDQFEMDDYEIPL